MSESSSMAKGWRIQIALLLLLLSGAALLWWLELRETQRTAEEKSSRLIGKFAPNSVKKVQFWRPAREKGKEGNALTIVRNELPKEAGSLPSSRWQIQLPERVRTSDAAVEQLLAILSESYEQKVTDKVTDPAAFGLDSPVAVLTAYNEAEQAVQISLGMSAPASRKRYIQIGVDGPVVLVPPKLVDGLMQQQDGFRDKHLFARQMASGIEKFTRERPNERLELNKKDKQWWLLSPIQDMASENRVNHLLETLTQAQGNSFVALPADETTAVAEDWLLTLHFSDQQERVRLQRRDNRLLAWRAGEPDAMVLDAHLAEELNKPAMELIALRPLEQGVQIKKLEISHRGKSQNASKQGEEWEKPVWKGIEEVLTRDAWRGVKAKDRGEPWLQIVVRQDERHWQIPFWKEGESLFLAPANRSLQLELTHYQAKSFLDTIKALFPEE
ncbi:DUF4340 domain-containing protein [Candidatus Magnetaquicoccus inordinatus]|uniref:DUF4340 domain-containing protein n=1 Tax=Candidatus Magnetaquicoccus inordinatus TaxID=2496818 RepID=UPI00102B889B|nr:DUF4340 domain-containing protein [Candidatus Magnetaquicoccus inordinatus]